jgi:hypothetical protein
MLKNKTILLSTTLRSVTPSSGAGCIKLFIIFILRSMVFPAIRSVHRNAISARIALLEGRFVLKSHLLSTNHIRVLSSANPSYLIIGFKQPMNFKKNVIWQMSKNKTFTCHDLILEYLLSNFCTEKQKIWIATVNYQRIAKNFNFLKFHK